MDLKTLKKTSKELELEVIGENETILNPIVHVLLDDKNVEYAACIVDHPLSNRRRLFIRVKDGKPEEILKKAVKKLGDEVKQFNKAFQDTNKKK